MSLFLILLLGCLCFSLLIPAALLGHYAGLRVLLVSAITLFAALTLAAVGGALAWLLFALNEVPPQAITIGVTIGFLAGLVLGALGSLRLTKPGDTFDL